MSFKNRLGEFVWRPGASEQTLQKTQAELGLALPVDYLAFLKESNGGEGFIDDGYIMVWAAEELAPFNADYQVKEYAPGLLLFGSNGSGEAYAFDRRSGVLPIVQVPFVGMDLRHARPIAKSIDALLRNERGTR